MIGFILSMFILFIVGMCVFTVFGALFLVFFLLLFKFAVVIILVWVIFEVFRFLFL